MRSDVQSERVYERQRAWVQRHAGWPKRNTFGKEKGGKKTKLVQKAAFPSLPSPYGFPLWTLFSLSLSLSSLCRLLTAPQNPSGLLSGLFCLWESSAFHWCRKRKQSRPLPVSERAEQAPTCPGPASRWRQKRPSPKGLRSYRSFPKQL